MKLVKCTALFLVTMFSIISCTQTDIEWFMAQETKHFRFYTADQAEDDASQLSELLEANYDRIITDFQLTESPQFTVYIFPDIETYHVAIDRPDAPLTSIGTVKGTEIWLVSPLNPGGAHDTQSVLTVGVHEFTHAVVNYVNGSLDQNNYDIPIWLNEGLAVYEAGQMTPDWREGIAKRVADGEIPSINNDLVPDRFNQVGGLAFSATLVEYLIEEYGFEKIVELIKTPSDLELILGVNISELDAAWRIYLQENYHGTD